MMRLPDRIFAQPLLVRGALLWAGVRSAMALIAWLMAGMEGAPTLEVTVKAAAWIVLVVGGLGILELRRRNEHLLLANLGIYQRTLGLLAAAPALLGEIAIALALADGPARG